MRWRPVATLDMLRQRAALLAAVRSFFAARGVLEVETPLLGDRATTDTHIASLRVSEEAGVAAGHLQFSPEFAMKRLVCAGSGPIYQIGKAFRGGEAGRWHNPEFTMLEWYRPGFDHHTLMDEVDALLAHVSGEAVAAPRRIGCRALCRARHGLDVFVASDAELAALASRNGLVDATALDRTDLLDHLLSLAAGDEFANDAGYVFDFPVEQAALARLAPADRGCAQRFELYLAGQEVGNGYHELGDADEARRRMQHENARRRRRGLAEHLLDERLLAAMRAGMPACAGVALGVDRLLAVLTAASSLAEVLAFPRDIA